MQIARGEGSWKKGGAGDVDMHARRRRINIIAYFVAQQYTRLQERKLGYATSRTSPHEREREREREI
jgi:hypothetical protein